MSTASKKALLRANGSPPMARSVSICPLGRKVVTAVELAIFKSDNGEGIVPFDPPGQLAYLTGVVNAEEQPAAAAPVASALPAREGAATCPDDLTAREVEVLRLLAQGWSDAQIAQQLVISPRTVNRHTTSIYTKIGVSSRSAATHYPIKQHLA